jgi:hypothetical protein
MMQLIKIIMVAIVIFMVVPTIGYKLMGNNWPLLLVIVVVAPLFLPKGMKGGVFLVMLLLLALVWWKYDALNGALSKAEKSLTRGLTPQQARDQADKATDDLATKAINASLDKMQQTLNSCLITAAHNDPSLGPKMNACISNPAGRAYQQTSAFQTCMEGVYKDANPVATEAAAQCHSQVQKDLDDSWQGFLVAVLCKIPSEMSNPKCPK